MSDVSISQREWEWTALLAMEHVTQGHGWRRVNCLLCEDDPSIPSMTEYLRQTRMAL